MRLALLGLLVSPAPDVFLRARPGEAAGIPSFPTAPASLLLLDLLEMVEGEMVGLGETVGFKETIALALLERAEESRPSSWSALCAGAL